MRDSLITINAALSTEAAGWDRSPVGDYSGVIRLWERIGLATGSIPVRLTDARQ